MKRIILLLTVFAIAKVVSAQNPVVSAYNQYTNQVPDKAKQYIDEAIKDEKYAGQAKTWFYRGNIYLQVSNVAHLTDGLVKGMTANQIKQRLGEPLSMRNYRKLPDGAKWLYNFDLVLYLSHDTLDHYDYPDEALYRSLDDGHALETAYNSYQKALELDPDIKSIQLSPMSPMFGIQAVASNYYNFGIIAYEHKKYKEAQYNLEQALKTFKAINKSDPELTYYTGVQRIAAGDTVSALKYYNEAVQLGYKEKYLYTNLVNIYLAENKIDEAKKAIKKGREIYPEDKDMLITEANIYLKIGESKEAEKILLKALEKDPSNAQLYYVVGANYFNITIDSTATKEEKQHAFEEAEKAYKKVIELDAGNYNANFDLGALYYNKAVEINTYVKNLPIDAEEEYNKGIKEAKEYWLKAQPYLEKAHELNPDKRNPLVFLRRIYMATNNTAKYKEVSEMLKKM